MWTRKCEQTTEKKKKIHKWRMTERNGQLKWEFLKVIAILHIEQFRHFSNWTLFIPENKQKRGKTTDYGCDKREINQIFGSTYFAQFYFWIKRMYTRRCPVQTHRDKERMRKVTRGKKKKTVQCICNSFGLMPGQKQNTKSKANWKKGEIKVCSIRRMHSWNSNLFQIHTCTRQCHVQSATNLQSIFERRFSKKSSFCVSLLPVSVIVSLLFVFTKCDNSRFSMSFFCHSHTFTRCVLSLHTFCLASFEIALQTIEPKELLFRRNNGNQRNDCHCCCLFYSVGYLAWKNFFFSRSCLSSAKINYRKLRNEFESVRIQVFQQKLHWKAI